MCSNLYANGELAAPLMKRTKCSVIASFAWG